MPKAIQTISIATITAMIGCAPAAIVPAQRVQEAIERQAMRSWPCFVYYCGSKGGFDYFREEEPNISFGSKVNRFRVAESEQAISNRFPYTTNRSQWRSLSKYQRPSQ
jgi:hypothetical protein